MIKTKLFNRQLTTAFTSQALTSPAALRQQGRTRYSAIGLVISSLFSALWLAPALAQQDLLTQAQVYKLVNTVQLLPKNQAPRQAKLSDILVPLDALKTASRSKAELLFNEGSLARVGSNAIFRFVPGTRSFQLRNGTALIMSLPGRVGTKVETPGGQILAQALPAPASSSTPTSPTPTSPTPASPTPTSPSPSSPPPFPSPLPPPEPRSLAMIVQFDAATNKAQVFALTNSSITVFDLKGRQIALQGGQTVAIVNGILGPVQTFDLKTFYQSSNLAIGLGPGQDSVLLQESPPVQQTLKSVRVETLAALEAQARWLEGLCTLNARGGGSTLATNCITTDADDPLRDFQNRREVTTPPQRETIPPQIPEPPVVTNPTPPVVVDPPLNTTNTTNTTNNTQGNNNSQFTGILIPVLIDGKP